MTSSSDDEEYPYELTITVEKGTVVGGGLAHNTYVETWIDGELINTTEPAAPPPEWNETFKKEFKELEPSTPIIVSFLMYKKRWTSAGYKYVGRTQFALTDLMESLNKGSTTKNMSLIASKKNITLNGSLQLQLDLKDKKPKEDAQATKKQRFSGTVYARLMEGDRAFTANFYNLVMGFDNRAFGRVAKAIVLFLWILFLVEAFFLCSNYNTRIQGLDAGIERIDVYFGQFLTAGAMGMSRTGK